MRSRVITFVCWVLISLAIVPGFNILSKTLLAGAPSEAQMREKWWSHASYNLDFMSSWLNRLLYQFGISTNPTQAIIGYEGWLYLGDEYEQTRSVARRGQTKDDLLRSERIAKASTAWEIWLKQKGVRFYRVMIAPDKGTIYSEHLPNWAKPSLPSATDALLGYTGSRNYIDLRPAVLHAKNEIQSPLYYRTDTHWNSLGAAYAFSAFMDNMHHSDPALIWDKNEISVLRVDARSGGDLSRFLRLQESLTDDEPVIDALGEHSIETVQYDFLSGRVIGAGSNPLVGAPDTPIRVVSSRAPNKRRVLWLRDSFGTALSPLMAATFTETIQLHWGRALNNNAQLLIGLVDAWHPDYVVVTVVEREARARLFETMPPGANGG